jgi:micrococcal nuclease
MRFLTMFVLLLAQTVCYPLSAEEASINPEITTISEISAPAEPVVSSVSEPIKKEEKAESSAPKMHKGKVSAIHNSVTFTVKDEKDKEHVLRLAEISTPYLDKFHGPESLKALKELIENKEISYEVVTTGQNGNRIVKAKLGDVNLNAFMVEKGHAWVSKKFGRDPVLFDLQDKAKAARLGIWANLKHGHGAKNMRRRVHHS